MTSIAIDLWDLNFRSCLMNASGALCTTLEELDNLDKSKSGAVVSKSCSQTERVGNPKPRYFHNTEISLNSMGLPNKGYNYYLMSAQHISNKPFVMSIATLDPLHSKQIVEVAILNPKVAMIELNVSCPNICSSNQILGYHLEDLDNYLAHFEACFQMASKQKKPIGIKLPPYWEAYQFQEMSKIIIKYGLSFITTINSIPNCLVIDTETESPVIAPKNGIGGLGGKFVKPVVLSNIFQFRQLLPKEIVIIGCGGIETGEDVFHHLLAGASLVQIGTRLMQYGTTLFGVIEQELIAIMQKKGYKTLGEIIGNIKSNVINDSKY